jgi:tetratricopeptide (TPR) repeat protein
LNKHGWFEVSRLAEDRARKIRIWKIRTGPRLSSVCLSMMLCAPISLPSSLLCAQALAPDHPPAGDLAAARDSVKQGRYLEAEKQLREYVAGHPADAEARYLLAFTLFRENKPADSLNEYTEAARHHPPRAEDLKTVALDYVLLNDYADAEHWIRYAVSMDPNDGEAWYEAGRIEYTLNYFHPALDAFQRSLQLDPASVKAENNLGLTFEGLNRTDEAIAAYRKALAMQAGSPHPSEQPFLNLATVLIDRNQFDEALGLLQQAQQIAPNDAKILAQLGRLYMEKGNLDAARTVLERAVAIEPEKASLHFQLGQVYKKSGATEKAQAEFTTTQRLLGTTSSAPQ